YFKYVNENFKLKEDELFYWSTNDSTNLPLEKMSALIFLDGNRIATIDEVQKILESQCSPKKLVKQTTTHSLEKSFSPSLAAQNLPLKNLITGEYLKMEQNQKIAIYFFTYLLGKNGL